MTMTSNPGGENAVFTVHVDPEGMSTHIEVLDKGYVRLVDKMGTDLSVVNAARASFAKESMEMSQADARLIQFLWREGHHSPFRHAALTFEFKAPLMVARQHWKYIVGSDHTMEGWNESSRRYVTSDEEFYVPQPDQWRSAPANKKQGSGEPVPIDIGSFAFEFLLEDQERALAHYNWALSSGICAEQARLFLPAYGLYVNYRWTASLQSVMHFLAQRLEEDAQQEIQEYARAVHILAQPLFPISFEAFRI
jgi:thymidylate synthase (FAD)